MKLNGLNKLKKIIDAIKKFWNKLPKEMKLICKCTAIVCLAMIVVAVAFRYIKNYKPYTICFGNEKVCCVRSKEATKDTLMGVAKAFSPEDAEVKAYSLSEDVKVNLTPGVKRSETMSVNEAVEYISEEYIPDNKIEIKVTSSREEVKKFTPKPKYKKGKKMLAGEKKVKSKAVKGKKRVAVQYKTKNGKITGHKDHDIEILDEGTPAVIYKGILGLPEGEDWKTFDGDPIFKDGDELGTTAVTYKGLRYRYGGNSLKTGVDCVTFVWNMYRLYGINLKCSHAGLRAAGKGVSLKNAKRGDIVCYYGHVAIYLGNGKIVHASPGKGVHVSNNVKYRKIRTIRRVVKK